MAKLDTNDRSASTDDAAGEANVSPMAPFRRALKRMEQYEDRLACEWNAIPEDETEREALALARYVTASQCSEMLAEALQEATDHDEAGGRSSTPSG